MNEKKKHELAEAALNKQFSLNFTQRELIIIFNSFLKDPNTGAARTYSLGLSRLVNPILDKIEPFCAVDSNIIPSPEEKT